MPPFGLPALCRFAIRHFFDHPLPAPDEHAPSHSISIHHIGHVEKRQLETCPEYDRCYFVGVESYEYSPICAWRHLKVASFISRTVDSPHTRGEHSQSSGPVARRPLRPALRGLPPCPHLLMRDGRGPPPPLAGKCPGLVTAHGKAPLAAGLRGCLVVPGWLLAVLPAGVGVGRLDARDGAVEIEDLRVLLV